MSRGRDALYRSLHPFTATTPWSGWRKQGRSCLQWSTATTAATTSPPAPSHLSPPPTTSASCPLRSRSRTSRTSSVTQPQPTTSQAASGWRGAAGAAARCVLSAWRLFCRLLRHELRTLTPVFLPLQLPRNAGWLAAFKVSPPGARRRGLQRPRSHGGGDERVRRLFDRVTHGPLHMRPADTTMQSPRHLLWSTRRWAAQLRASRSSGAATTTSYASCLTLLGASAWRRCSAAPQTGAPPPATAR